MSAATEQDLAFSLLQLILTSGSAPIAATIAIWLAAIFWPTEADMRGDVFAFNPFITAFLRLIAASAATLLVWLAFFICLFIVGRS